MFNKLVLISNSREDIAFGNGVIAPPAAIADSWEGLADGVYAVRPDLKPANIVDEHEGNSLCIGVGLVNTAKSQRLMIEKYENANNAESTTIYTKAAQQLGSTYTYDFSWGGYGSDKNGITNYTNADGSNTYGYLPNSGGSYSGSPQLSDDPSTWISGALYDFAGKSNSEVIKNITTNGSHPSTTAPMSYLMNAFNAEDCPISVNQGFRDWFISSCGQLGLIWLNLTAINNALTAIGGTTFTAYIYWSSSEYSSNIGWYVSLSNGIVYYYNGKFNDYRLRLVRDL